jgi:hypothetical protein
MNSKPEMLTRRRILRGVLAGGSVTVGLPILDCMLNENGNAFAATGAPVPTRFASWFWPLGLGEAEWRPKTSGTDYDMPTGLAPLKPFQKRMNLFSGSQVFLDGVANQTHFTGMQGLMTGKVTSSGDYFNSVDGVIADRISTRNRFKSLVAVCNGDPKASWTAFAGGKVPAETSPMAMYTRIFGPEFADPNAATFVPDPETMVRRSVLSGVSEERQKLNKWVGAGDRHKLDYYFSALRALEQKLDIQLAKPAPLPACKKPDVIKDDGHPLSLASEAMARHDLFCALMAHALACDQTRVVNVNISQGMTDLRREGDTTSHHSLTHEEPIDLTLRYQVKCSWFQQLYFKGLHDFAMTLDSIQEGDGTLLDHMMVFAFTDHGAPRVHSLLNYPMITIGGANGQIKTGNHFATPGEAATRVTFTIQQAMGVPISSWGSGSNQATLPISGVLA